MSCNNCPAIKALLIYRNPENWWKWQFRDYWDRNRSGFPEHGDAVAVDALVQMGILIPDRENGGLKESDEA